MTAYAFFRDRKVIPLQLMDLMLKVNKLAECSGDSAPLCLDCSARCVLCLCPLQPCLPT